MSNTESRSAVTTQKRCSKCGQTKSADDFYMRKKGPRAGELMAACKVCQSAATRRYLSTSQGKAKAAEWNQSETGRQSKCRSAARWRENNPAAVAEQRRKRQARPEWKAYFQTPKAKAMLRRARKAWRATAHGKAMHQEQERRRRARKRTAEVRLTIDEWEAIRSAAKGRCHYCRKRRKLTQDHVIPLSKGGHHVKENIVAACQSCNSKKHDKVLTLF